MLWIWEASVPGAAASGVCGDVGQARFSGSSPGLPMAIG